MEIQNVVGVNHASLHDVHDDLGDALDIPHSMARVELIVGPMFSGKTTELLKRISRFDALDIPTLLLTSTLDTRAKGISTHSNIFSNIPVRKVRKLSEVIDECAFIEASVVGIDEAQFFDDIVKFVQICEQRRKHVIIAGLDGDFRREPFGDILRCVPLCDSVDKLAALELKADGTTRPAIFTHRCDDSNTNIIDIGGENKYIAVSRESYLRLRSK